MWASFYISLHLPASFCSLFISLSLVFSIRVYLSLPLPISVCPSVRLSNLCLSVCPFQSPPSVHPLVRLSVCRSLGLSASRSLSFPVSLSLSLSLPLSLSLSLYISLSLCLLLCMLAAGWGLSPDLAFEPCLSQHCLPLSAGEKVLGRTYDVTDCLSCWLCRWNFCGDVFSASAFCACPSLFLSLFGSVCDAVCG